MLKSALEHAVREEEIPRNVARNVRTGTPRPRRFEPLTADEARQFLVATRGHRLHALFELALHTGLRKGELLGLRWEDLDHDAGTAAIRRTLQRTNTGGLTTAHQDTGLRTPHRPPHSLKLHHEQQRERKTAGTTWQHSGHVFTTAQGRAIDPTNLTRVFATLLRKAGLRRIRFHDLRHSTATLLLEQGVELVVIKELLGHAHIGVTATVYATSDSASSATPSTPSAPRSTAPRPSNRPTATATNRRPSPPSSADVAVNYCRQTPRGPPESSGGPRGNGYAKPANHSQSPGRDRNRLNPCSRQSLRLEDSARMNPCSPSPGPDITRVQGSPPSAILSSSTLRITVTPERPNLSMSCSISIPCTPISNPSRLPRCR
ncbi:tyrosine-type recombinase/integrase [Streptomyces griseoincarnatus]